MGAKPHTVSIPIRARPGNEDYSMVSEFNNDRDDTKNGNQHRDGSDGQVQDAKTHFKLPELRFLGRRLTVVLRFFSLVAC